MAGPLLRTQFVQVTLESNFCEYLYFPHTSFQCLHLTSTSSPPRIFQYILGTCQTAQKTALTPITDDFHDEKLIPTFHFPSYWIFYQL